MNINSIGFTVKEGIRNIMRHKGHSIASLITMAACIFLFSIFYAVLANFQSVVHTVESSVAVTVFFDEGTTQEEIDQIGNEIASRDEVSEYNFVSAEEAWEEYKMTYFEGDEEAAAAFGDVNPLANEASYEIYMEDVSMQQELVEYLQGLEHVREVQQSESVANTLTEANKLITIISSAFIAILICIAIFLISNTVRAGITARKNQIGVMKMIGATDSFVRSPFIIEGVLIGAVGALIPMVFLYFGYNRVINTVADKFGFLDSIITFIPVGTIFKVLLPVGLALGIGVGYAGSRLTVHKHINV